MWSCQQALEKWLVEASGAKGRKDTSARKSRVIEKCFGRCILMAIGNHEIKVSK
jgi:hypothetical protein